MEAVFLSISWSIPGGLEAEAGDTSSILISSWVDLGRFSDKIAKCGLAWVLFIGKYIINNNNNNNINSSNINSVI